VTVRATERARWSSAKTISVRWSFLTNLPIALGFAWLWAFLAFLIGRVNHRHATIDVFWGAGFLVVYLECLRLAHAGYSRAAPSFTNRYVVLAFVAVWGLRLAIYLARRQRGAKEDARYVTIMKGARGRYETLYALRVIYGLQGLLLWFVSLPLQWIAFHERVDGLFVPGLVLAAIGVVFEATGDEQLRRFIADPANRGTTMNRGLWRYTRHPNYFGDALVWCGFYVVACSSGWGWLTILSPVAMIYLLTSLSGTPMLERMLAATRAGYDEYVATTSSFIPRRPRKRSQFEKQP
jgi:steroid 5-alpha reductase family enzyme